MLGEDVAAFLPELRAQAESLMTAACAITRSGPLTWNPSTLQHESSTVSVYTGKCRVKRGGAQGSAETVADQTLTESAYAVHLPVVGSEGILVGDVVTITACPDDAEMVGRVFTVEASPAYSQGTARRVPVRESQ